MAERLEELAEAAARGDADALTTLISEIQHQIYGLALRFLGDPHDAEDATQEILLRVTTRLATFEGRSKFMTWTYTIATRMLLRTKQGTTEALIVSPERFGQILDDGLSDHDPTVEHAQYEQLVEEVRISCTYGMLLCLSRPLRAAYILGDVLGLPDTAGAEVCDIKPPAFRQRLARARKVMRQVIDGRCGLIDSANRCRCQRQIDSGVDAGLLNPDHLPFANHPRIGDPAAFARAADELDDLVAIGSLYQSDRFAAPATVWIGIQKAFPNLAGPGST